MKKHIAILFRILGYYLLYILLANATILLIMMVFGFFGIEKLPGITGEFLADLIIIPSLILIFQLYKTEKRKELFASKLEWSKLLRLIPISIFARIGLVVCLMVLAVGVFLIVGKDIGTLIDQGVHYQWEMFDKAGDIEKIFGFFSFVILGPISEEILNRAVILTDLRKHYAVRTSIIYSSIIFTLAHIHPGLYLSSFILGLLLAFVYIKWKNIWYSIILHMLINLQPFILAYFIQR